uniref:CRM domain-containing protein n=1 Tax=Populus davidiana TaxID=266767 RepID=A0A6M2EF99_9ROSI
MIIIIIIMLGIAASIRGGVGIGRRLSFAIRKESLTWYRNLLVQNPSDSFNYTPSVVCCFLWAQRPGFVLENFARHMSTASLELRTDNDFVRFSITKDGYSAKEKKSMKKVPRYVKMSKKAKLNELRLYRLKAKKKMNSPNPEVRIRYKLEKAKRKEAWLIEKLRKLEVPKTPGEAYDPEILTDEEKHYFKRTGEKKKNYVPVGRRGVFGGVVLNMHLHWKKHETVKVTCKPCKPGQIHEYAEELARLSKGIVIDIRPDSTIIFYRGKNYVQPKIMSPPDTLSKDKALEKYRYEQSLEHTSQFIEKLEKELENYQEHVVRYKKRKEAAVDSAIADDGLSQITNQS